MSETRSRGRRQRRRGDAVEAPTTFAQRPFTQLKKSYQPVAVATDEQLEAIHQASLKVLAETGLRVLLPQARRIMSEAGAEVDESTEQVRFDPDLIMEKIATVPSEFTLHARNPEHSVVLGGDNVVFDMMASAPNCSDIDRGRRTGNQEDYRNFLRLAQMHNILHVTGGYPVEPVDVHASIRHLDCIYDYITLTDKAYCIYSLGEDRVADSLEMTRIAHGLTMEQLREKTCLFSIINTNSPLQLDIPMMQGVIDLARMNQAVVITPFTLSGAMAPVTIAGAVVQQNAEALAAVALLQKVREGAPCVYGAFTSNVDMKTGAPAFGTPEYVRAMQMSGQMARRYGLPWRASNANACNAPDAQAVWESAFSLQGSCSGHANMIYHAAGWMEGGLSASFEKFIIDCEMLQQIVYTNRPVPMSADDLAVEAIDSVGPFGHFFGADHTQERYRDAFYAPLMSDWRNFESWEEAGAVWTHQRANTAWKQILAEYEKPEIDPAIDEELCAFIERRKTEGGAPTDF